MTETVFRSDSAVSLVNSMASDNNVAMSAWISFGNDNESRLEDRNKVEGLINFLYRNQHLTPFESSVFTFRVETPIFVAREVFRHRSSSFNEWSGRYSKMLPHFYMPDSTRPLQQEGKAGDYRFVAGSSEQYSTVYLRTMEAFEQSWYAYEQMTAAGVAKEVARNVLPLATYTQYYVTMNARNLMHFLDLRTADNALYEIRQLAGEMEKHFAKEMPLTFAAWKKYGNKS